MKNLNHGEVISKTSFNALNLTFYVVIKESELYAPALDCLSRSTQIALTVLILFLGLSPRFNEVREGTGQVIFLCCHSEQSRQFSIERGGPAVLITTKYPVGHITQTSFG